MGQVGVGGRVSGVAAQTGRGLLLRGWGNYTMTVVYLIVCASESCFSVTRFGNCLPLWQKS